MKIIYCNHSTCNPGGMERVLLNKVRYLVEVMHWEVMIVTTDQHNRPPFYPLPVGVRIVDLGINYSEDNIKGVIGKTIGYLKKRRLHKKKLATLLEKEKPDITVSLFPSESSFIPDLKDGSKKILELHFCKFFRLQYGRSGFIGLIDRWRSKQDETLVKKFNKFVVLTNEDKGYWEQSGVRNNICVIPNAAVKKNDFNTFTEKVTNKRIIAVGRLDYQKGFDRLIEAWRIVQKETDLQDWHLDIFGQGEWKTMLNTMIHNYHLENTTTINRPTKQIDLEYHNSDFIVMTSNYEGFGMVLVEAMVQGIPAISFNCTCGPSDIIQHEINGLLVENGNIPALAESMIRLMRDKDLRIDMGKEAIKVTETYSEERVMGKWIRLFEKIAAS